MLSLRNIVKTYKTGDSEVHALAGVSIDFRANEFVSILGPSGCGKTTLLNVIGGLDRYDSGDLVINGRSTKEYRDADWDTYRNHSVGFVFQSYNLITHQSVLANVELALTLSGVSRDERRRRAIEALEKVGLGDQLHKKPNQMSGGQMQRVAIARALVNDPDILLADEPTGALDTATSVQVMELLKEIAREKLVVMVTHNPELAEEYSTRIIRLLDGQLTDDSDPFTAPEVPVVSEVAEPADAPDESVVVLPSVDDEQIPVAPAKKAKKKKRSMSFWTALTLSFTNLLTKKGRTLLVSVAGSIGIIGIALILALSNGVSLFISAVQEDTLSTYPLSIKEQEQDVTAMMGAMMGTSNGEDYTDMDMIGVDDSLGTMMSAMSATVKNNLTAFKAHIDKNRDKLDPLVTDIKYTYNFDLQIFTADGKTQVNPTEIFDNMGSSFQGIGEMMKGMGVFSEMIDNQELLNQQYEVVAGRWPSAYDEVVLVVTSDNQLSKMTLYMLGVLDQSELEDIMEDLMTEGKYDTTPLPPYSYDDFLNMQFLLLNTSDFFVKREGHTYTPEGSTEAYPVWRDLREGLFDQEGFVTENGLPLKITGIIRPQPGATATSISGAVGYTKALTDYILAQNAASEIINQQKATPDYNVLTGVKFERTVYTRENIDQLIRAIDPTTMQTIYDEMTKQVHDAFEKNPPVNADTLVIFASMMNDTQYKTLVESMLTAVKADATKATQLATLCAVLTNMLNISDVTVTPDNLVALLPLMDATARMVIIAGVP
ncbi:MAG: ABC transporter ATP-binding protein, partial [Clostridia bacterium]|nr:ABC transporter ATP-binding protein [Clostridia bacterium]